MNREFEMRRVDLETYSEGDAEFKKELVGLLIANIVELRASLHYAIERRKADKYLSACHKMRTTIGILNADDFAENIDSIREMLVEGAYPSALFDEHLARFNELSEGIIEGLRHEVKNT